MIRIESNGSTFTGESPKPIEALLEALKDNPLHPQFEGYGDFITCLAASSKDTQPVYRFFGNFFKLSHVFKIDTDEPELVKTLQDAIAQNKASDAYQAARNGFNPCKHCHKLAMFCKCPAGVNDRLSRDGQARKRAHAWSGA